jgi:hypothetical protein
VMAARSGDNERWGELGAVAAAGGKKKMELKT